jgi:pimeloyl-ACP methyl ester carboxylesterase
VSFEEITFEANGLHFRALTAGQGPLALLLHGFPDTPHTFSKLIPALADAGYLVVAPWMRGYAPTQVPADPFTPVAVLVQDAAGMVDALSGPLGAGDAVVIGHDWGALAAYGAAVLCGPKVQRVVGCAVGHPAPFMQAMMTNYAQQKRSWYMFFFQLPLADIAVPQNDFAFLERLWREWSPGFEPPKELLAQVRASLSAPGALETALGYYRATFSAAPLPAALAEIQDRILSTPIESPTLYLHGERDGCIGAELVQGMEAFFTGGFEAHVIPDVGHFLHLEAPEEVNRRILNFLKA